MRRRESLAFEGRQVTRNHGARFGLPNPFGDGGRLELVPGDVQFTDVDGDVVTLRPVSGDQVLWTSWSRLGLCCMVWGWMENLRFGHLN